MPQQLWSTIAIKCNLPSAGHHALSCDLLNPCYSLWIVYLSPEAASGHSQAVQWNADAGTVCSLSGVHPVRWNHRVSDLERVAWLPASDRAWVRKTTSRGDRRPRNKQFPGTVGFLACPSDSPFSWMLQRPPRFRNPLAFNSPRLPFSGHGGGLHMLAPCYMCCIFFRATAHHQPRVHHSGTAI